MIREAQRAEIRRLFYAEHWRIGTIARELSLHPDTVRAALETARFNRRTLVRPSRLDPYTDFIRTTLEQYPKLRATRIHEMIVARGYPGAVGQTRRLVRTPSPSNSRGIGHSLRPRATSAAAPPPSAGR